MPLLPSALPGTGRYSRYAPPGGRPPAGGREIDTTVVRREGVGATPGGEPEILLVRFSSLGDVVLATAAARALKERRPGARVTFLTRAAYAPLLQGQPSIDRVVGYGSGGREGLLPLVRLCRGLGRFDAVVDLHLSPRSRLSALMVRAARRFGYRKEAVLRRLWVAGLMRGRMTGEGHHVVDRYLDALRPLGVTGRGPRPELRIAREEVERAGSFLQQRGVADPRSTAVLVPGARWPTKRWREEGFVEVGRWLKSERGLQPVIVGDGEDREAAERIAGALGGEGAVDITGTTDLVRMAAVLSLARAVVGNDSGPGHIAAAVGAPLVTLFGPTVEAFGFVPLGDRAKTVSLPIPCRPCSLHGGRQCPRGRRACLDDIPASTVIDALREILPPP